MGACYLNTLSIDDYAAEAFCYDAKSGAFTQGGIHVGDKKSLYWNKLDREITARARFVDIAPGKIFARWVGSWCLQKGWETAASGAWWSSDNMVEQIMTKTVAKHGRFGSSSMVAREFSNVGYTWEGKPDDRGPEGTYRSNMEAVVVCRTKVPIKVLVGVGRPVVNLTLRNGHLTNVAMVGKELQVVMLTTWDGRFRGNEFLEKLFFGSAHLFTRWWLREDPLKSRRIAQVASFRR